MRFDDVLMHVSIIVGFIMILIFIVSRDES